jgi:hypothetical protein
MSSKLVLKPLWNNGSCTYAANLKRMSSEDRREVEELADEAGYIRLDDIWTPPSGAGAVSGFFEKMRQAGFALEFEGPDDAPFDLQRLHLSGDTRRGLEGLDQFELYHLSGWTPVQAEGRLDGRYFYFRARGSYWRFEWGGNEKWTRSPRWWHEECWPSVTGFEAGYMSDEEAVSCILKAIDLFRNGDNSHFQQDHPDYERTILEGWSAGALSLRIVTIRLGISSKAAVERMQILEIELPYTAAREVQYVDSLRVRKLKPRPS